MALDTTELKRREKIVVDQYGGISPPYAAFYFHSLRYCTERALTALHRFDHHLTSKDAALLTALIHEALGHASALSRFFWPSPSSKFRELNAARANKLRQMFNVQDESPLKDRSLRNALEHFDERLDLYLLTNDAGYFFPEPMIADHHIVDEPAGHVFKLLDPANGIIVILGEKFDFIPLRNEIVRIYEILFPLVR